jgi:hypothetical protein
VFAVGHGPDKAHALLKLWRTLRESDAAAEAIDYVAVEYRRRTGQSPLGVRSQAVTNTDVDGVGHGIG